MTMAAPALTPLVRPIRPCANDDTRAVVAELGTVAATLGLSPALVDVELGVQVLCSEGRHRRRLTRGAAIAAGILATKAGRDADALLRLVYRSWYGDPPAGADRGELAAAIPARSVPSEGTGAPMRREDRDLSRVSAALDAVRAASERWEELDGLTPQQLRTLIAIAGTRNLTEAARLLCVRPQTLKNHVTTIRRRFGQAEGPGAYPSGNPLVVMTHRWLMERGGLAPEGEGA